MRKYVLMSLCLLFALFTFAPSASAESVRKERKLIMEGNKLYNSGQYRLALKKYQEALEKNGASKSGRYNLGLTQIRLGSNPADTTPQAKSLLQEGQKNLQAVAQLGGENLGNVAFNAEDYQSALSYYKQSLRLNPADNAAKRNLRITQLKLQNQNQNQDQNQDKNQGQNQDKNEDKDQNKDQNQDQNKDQNQDKQDQQQNQPKEQDINQQTADQILQAMENKENQTRARIGKGNNGEKSRGHTKRRKNW